ncbi:unnamed protein product [Symbiodinium natans]|uniref:Uncharacterized protein n=1 Tax=Symbiodinium natans TaxID=878477 RepID=A0A812LLL8_9DINO|nr:unnamed protein product [Symbiodinium natans]
MSGKGRKGAWGDQGFNSRGQDKGHKGQKGQKGKPTSSPTFFEEHAKGQKGKPGHKVGQDGPEHILMPTPCTDSFQTQQLLWSGQGRRKTKRVIQVSVREFTRRLVSGSPSGSCSVCNNYGAGPTLQTFPS